MVNFLKFSLSCLLTSLLLVSSYSCNKNNTEENGSCRALNSTPSSKMANKGFEQKALTFNTGKGRITLQAVTVDELAALASPASLSLRGGDVPNSIYLFVKSLATNLEGKTYLSADGRWNGANVTARDYDSNPYNGRRWKIELDRSTGMNDAFLFTNEDKTIFTKFRYMEVFLQDDNHLSDNASMWEYDESRPQSWVIMYLVGINSRAVDLRDKTAGPFIIVNVRTNQVLTIMEKKDDYSYNVRVGSDVTDFINRLGNDPEKDNRSLWIVEY